MELNFSKVLVGKKGIINQNIISGALPRMQTFKLSDSILEIKTQIYNRIRPIFKNGINGTIDDDWINKNLLLFIKDNTPLLKGQYKPVKADCEFCGAKHDRRDDYCDIRSKELKDGNIADHAQKITLSDLYAMLKYDRDIKLEVMINQETEANYKLLTGNFVN